MNRQNRESGNVSVALSGTTARIHRPSAAGQGLVAALAILAMGSTSAMANVGVRDVTFSVDMSVQVALGRFDPEAGHSVEVEIGYWFPREIFSLNREGTGMVYSATIPMYGGEGEWIGFSFKGVLPNGTLSEQASHWALLGPVEQPQILPTPYFSHIGPDDVAYVTLSVDMARPIHLGVFDPETMGVEMQFSHLHNWNTPLVREGTGSVYKVVMAIDLLPGHSLGMWYAFCPTGPNAPGCETGFRYLSVRSGDEPRTLPTVYFNDHPPPVMLDITFSVDMSRRIYLGSFDPQTMQVTVNTYSSTHDPFNAQSGLALTRDGVSAVYRGTFPFAIDTYGGFTQLYYQFCQSEDSGASCENIGIRRVSIQNVDEPVTLPTVHFNNQPPPTMVDVTFSVDMSAQMAKGSFDPESMTANLLVTTSPPAPHLPFYDNWTPLPRQGTSAIYSGTFTFGVDPWPNLSVDYHFCVSDENPVSCETIPLARFLVLAPEDDPVLLPIAYYNDELPRISSLSSTLGPFFTIRPPLGHVIDAVYGADLVLVDGAWSWNLLDPGEDYTLENGEVVLSPEERQVLRFEVRRAE